MLYTLVSDKHVLRRSAIKFYLWGTLITIFNTKIIQCGQQTITNLTTSASESLLCAVHWVHRQMFEVPPLSPDSPLFLLSGNAVQTPLRYNKVLVFLKYLLHKSGRAPDNVGLHSLCQSGSCYMHSIGLTLEDIRQAGDWQSLAALIYLARSIQGHIETDRRVLLPYNHLVLITELLSLSVHRVYLAVDRLRSTVYSH